MPRLNIYGFCLIFRRRFEFSFLFPLPFGFPAFFRLLSLFSVLAKPAVIMTIGSHCRKNKALGTNLINMKSPTQFVYHGPSFACISDWTNKNRKRKKSKMHVTCFSGGDAKNILKQMPIKCFPCFFLPVIFGCRRKSHSFSFLC